MNIQQQSIMWPTSRRAAYLWSTPKFWNGLITDTNLAVRNTSQISLNSPPSSRISTTILHLVLQINNVDEASYEELKCCRNTVVVQFVIALVFFNLGTCPIIILPPASDSFIIPAKLVLCKQQTAAITFHTIIFTLPDHRNAWILQV